MKAQHIVLPFLFIMSCCTISFAQTAKKENIKVWGNCGMCKKTIETAAKNAGASVADWNTETKVLAVSYNSKKTNSQKIQQLIAAAGYDTKDFTASDDAYNKLHTCCQYDRKAGSNDANAACCEGKDCCKKDATASCCADGKCEKGKDCCKDMAQCKEKGCCKS
jgi:periplasmic mercuric ion binding protein